MAEAQTQRGVVEAVLPRITIEFCTQCKWMLRAAYYAQELLSTFSLSLGEVALRPSTGGTFIVTITAAGTTAEPGDPRHRVLWDRRTDGGFPETKELKRRVRDVIAPDRDLGHVDRDHAKERKDVKSKEQEQEEAAKETPEGGEEGKEGECEECT